MHVRAWWGANGNAGVPVRNAAASTNLVQDDGVVNSFLVVGNTRQLRGLRIRNSVVVSGFNMTTDTLEHFLNHLEPNRVDLATQIQD